MVSTRTVHPVPTHSTDAANEDADIAALRSAAVLDVDGARVRLDALTTRGPVLLVFVRHFGCLFCKEQVADVRARRAELLALGVEPIVIGNGSVEEARAFAAEHAAPVRVLTDPTREAYCAAGMKRGVSTSLSFGVMKRATRAMLGGFRQTKTEGDPFQQGGLIALGADGSVRYRFISNEAGEHPRFDDVLAALR